MCRLGCFCNHLSQMWRGPRMELSLISPFVFSGHFSRKFFKILLVSQQPLTQRAQSLVKERRKRLFFPFFLALVGQGSWWKQRERERMWYNTTEVHRVPILGYGAFLRLTWWSIREYWSRFQEEYAANYSFPQSFYRDLATSAHWSLPFLLHVLTFAIWITVIRIFLTNRLFLVRVSSPSAETPLFTLLGGLPRCVFQ